MGIEPVDANGNRLVITLPVEIVQRLDNVLARLLLVIRSNGILTIQKDIIGITLQGLFKHAGIATGYSQLAALQPLLDLRVLSEAHAASFFKVRA